MDVALLHPIFFDMSVGRAIREIAPVKGAAMNINPIGINLDEIASDLIYGFPTETSLYALEGFCYNLEHRKYS